MFDTMFYRLTQWPQPERLTYYEAVQREYKHERMPLRLLYHFFELIDDHFRKLPTGLVALSLSASVIQFHRIWNREDRS
jgi:hypothetical protein